MKLYVCIIEDYYADEVEVHLKNKGYRMTKLASSGGFMKKGNTTFLFGVDDNDIQELSNELKAACLKVEEKKQRPNNQAYRYTAFSIPVNGLPNLINRS